MPHGSAVGLFLFCLLLLGGLFFGAFRLPALHGAVMRMRLFVVLAARTAEEKENGLSIFRHKGIHGSQCTGCGTQGLVQWSKVSPSRPSGRKKTSILKSHLLSSDEGNWGHGGFPHTSIVSATIPVQFSELDTSSNILRSDQEPVMKTPAALSPGGIGSRSTFKPAFRNMSANSSAKNAASGSTLSPNFTRRPEYLRQCLINSSCSASVRRRGPYSFSNSNRATLSASVALSADARRALASASSRLATVARSLATAASFRALSASLFNTARRRSASVCSWMASAEACEPKKYSPYTPPAIASPAIMVPMISPWDNSWRLNQRRIVYSITRPANTAIVHQLS
jgi:hypothetical protein